MYLSFMGYAPKYFMFLFFLLQTFFLYDTLRFGEGGYAYAEYFTPLSYALKINMIANVTLMRRISFKLHV